MREPGEFIRTADQHVFYRPGPPLDRFIDFMWAVPIKYAASTARERVLPTGAPSLVVNLGPEPLRLFVDDAGTTPTEVAHAVLCGARTRPLVIDTTTIDTTVGVQFKSGGARPFFGVPAEAVAEQAVSLDELWGAGTRLLQEQLLGAPDAVAQLRILASALRCRAREKGPSALHESLAAFEEPRLASVSEVNRRTGMSPKRLIALFREEVGLNPKAFWRVRRFQRALADLTLGTLRGAPLALAHGYYDQAHFLREFRAFAGCSPGEYLKARVGDSGHVAIGG